MQSGPDSRRRLARRSGRLRVALVVSRYHHTITDGLEAGARTALADAGLAAGDIETIEVPGTFELPQAAERVAASGRWSAVVCLGCVIKGETTHFDYIARAAADGITRAAQSTGVPVTFGVLTTNTIAQARVRSGRGRANKGREAALAALDLAELYARLRK
jgi:6,7-dimethyl-8-ribityllumazine synthase